MRNRECLVKSRIPDSLLTIVPCWISFPQVIRTKSVGQKSISMIWNYKHPILNRRWTVDDDGIHEERGGRVYSTVGWNDLEKLRGNRVSGSSGKRISLLLGSRIRTDFILHAGAAWSERFPEKCAIDRLNCIREGDRAAYLWFPLLVFAPLTVITGLLFAFPEYGSGSFDKLPRMVALAVVVVGAWIAWYWNFRRKFAQQDARGNRR